MGGDKETERKEQHPYKRQDGRDLVSVLVGISGCIVNVGGLVVF